MEKKIYQQSCQVSPHDLPINSTSHSKAKAVQRLSRGKILLQITIIICKFFSEKRTKNDNKVNICLVLYIVSQLFHMHFHLIINVLYKGDYLFKELSSFLIFTYLAGSQLQHTYSLVVVYQFSSCSMQAQLPLGMWDLSSLSKDQTHIHCTAKWIFNHWTTREVLEYTLIFYEMQALRFNKAQ